MELIITCLPEYVSFLWLHILSIFLNLSNFFFQLVSVVSMLPNVNPRMVITVLDHLRSIGLSVLSLNDPINNPSDLSMLIFAPDAFSYTLSREKTVSIDSVSRTCSVVSSAYALSLDSCPFGRIIPLIFSSLRTFSANTSAINTYRRALTGSPCRVPCPISKYELRKPLHFMLLNTSV